mmetsp:Transcript_3926/g.7141  ORF Transcript_3926/g.7141 Transcript_3926/m.7141 type:complete len:231 (-) Transcript_3926:331-1023(-)
MLAQDLRSWIRDLAGHGSTGLALGKQAVVLDAIGLPPQILLIGLTCERQIADGTHKVLGIGIAQLTECISVHFHKLLQGLLAILTNEAVLVEFLLQCQDEESLNRLFTQGAAWLEGIDIIWVAVEMSVFVVNLSLQRPFAHITHKALAMEVLIERLHGFPDDDLFADWTRCTKLLVVTMFMVRKPTLNDRILAAHIAITDWACEACRMPRCSVCILNLLLSRNIHFAFRA